VNQVTLDKLFIYGTLFPGEERWHFLEPFLARNQGEPITPDSAAGHLFDSGFGYPAARFDGTNTIADRIVGSLVSLEPSTVEECMELLDVVEGEPEGEFHRIIIETDAGVRAWSYQFGLTLPDLARIRNGSWAARDESPPEPGGVLSFLEGRIIGALIEKQLTTPQNYPLTMNALLSACNQKSSREPVTDLDEQEVMAVLTEGKERKLCRFVHPRSGHGVIKYRQVLDEFLELSRFGEVEAQLALLGVLMLRGPQTSRELRDRTARGYEFSATVDVEETLRSLVEQGHVERLDRQPGQRDERWRELLTPGQLS